VRWKSRYWTGTKLW